MQNSADRWKLLKQVEEGLAEINTMEEEISRLRLSLSNTSRQFLIAQPTLTDVGLVAFRQKLGKIFTLGLAVEDKAADLMEIVDQIQP